MRIAYVDPRPVPGNGVEALQIAQNVDAFARGCGEISLITPRPSAGASVEHLLGRRWHPSVGLEYVPDYRRCLPALRRSNRMFFFSARRRVRRHRPDALWVRHLRLAASLLDAPSHPPLFFETHEVFARSLEERAASPGDTRKVRRLRAIEGEVYARASGIIALTHGLAEEIRTEYGVATPVLVAADGFDALLAARPISPSRTGVPTILYLGSLHPWKGVDVLVRAMRDVTAAKLVIVGGEPAEIEALRRLAESERVSDRVDLAGPVAPSRRFECIASARICALPLSTSVIASRYTSPLKLFEYMAAGKPIVTTALPSIGEVVRHGIDAWLVERPDPALYAQAINRLLADDSLCRRLGEAASAASQAYTWERRARSIGSFIAAHLPGAA